jgi:hypothetical protein
MKMGLSKRRCMKNNATSANFTAAITRRSAMRVLPSSPSM